MVAILRAVALGVLILAITLHVIGFVTRDWVAAELDSRGIANIAAAQASTEMSKVPKEAFDGAGMSIGMGLWRFCVRINFGRMAQMAGAGLRPTDICKTAQSEDLPDWWKAVQALGILSLITAVVGVATVIYSFIGDSKGDRARLLPHFMAAICLLAGLLLLIAVMVYGTEFKEAMDQQLKALEMMGPTLEPLTENLRQNMSLGYSLALEAVAGVLMVLVSLLLALPIFRGEDALILKGGPRNLAV